MDGQLVDGRHLVVRRVVTGASAPAPGPVRRALGPLVRAATTGTGPVWLLVVALHACAAWLCLAVLPHVDGRSTGPSAPWWLLAAAFCLTEVAVVHYDFRRQAHTFSLFELPLTFGLFFASPLDLVLATVVGVGLALALHRRQRGLKLLFNVGHFALGACLAALLFSAVAGPGPGFTPASWGGALLAAVVSSCLSTGAIVLAIRLAEGRFEPDRLAEQVALALLTTAGGTSLGLMGVGITGQDTVAAWLLLVPVGTFLLALQGYVRQQSEKDNLELLYRSARALDEAPDLTTGIGRVLRGACRALRVELAQFAVPSPNDRSRVLVVTATADTHRVDEVAVADLDGPLFRALRSSAVEVLTLDPPAAGLSGHALHHVLTAPLRSEAHPLGALLVGNRLGTTPGFAPAHHRLLETLANLVSVSLENGRLSRLLEATAARADRERDNALVLQRSMLPTLPVVPGASVAVRYVPGAAEEEVGGDWFDVLALPSGGVGGVIGDVLGHDLQAAAKMAHARSVLRAYAAEGHPPSVVVELLDRLLAWTDPDFLGTCCYLQFDARTGRVTVVSAGHPPPVVVSADGQGRVVDLDPNLPLGVGSGNAFRSVSFQLERGATLVLYTDGLVESRTDSLDAGVARLVRVAAGAAGRDLQSLADEVLTRAPVGPTDDDVTLLLLRHPEAAVPGPGPTSADLPRSRPTAEGSRVRTR